MVRFQAEPVVADKTREMVGEPRGDDARALYGKPFSKANPYTGD